MYKHFCANRTMLEYCGRKIMFDKFPDCIKAINIAFQHGYQNGTNKSEQCIWYSRKHGAPGFKTEVAVGPDSQARYPLKSYPGSYHDFKIFKDAIDKHLEQLVKDNRDQKEQDNMSKVNYSALQTIVTPLMYRKMEIFLKISMHNRVVKGSY